MLSWERLYILIVSQQLRTLVVEYAPREEEPRTKKPRQHFTDLIQDVTDIEYLNLTRNLPPLFDH